MKEEISETEIMQEIVRKSMEWYNVGIQKFPQDVHEVEILFDLTGVKAGQAWWRKSGKFTIEYNLAMALENGEDFIQEVIPHEIAHLIANEFFKEMYPDGCGHSDMWKFVMIKFGRNPNRCHSFSVENLSKGHRDYLWKCSACGFEYAVGKNLHEKLQNPHDTHYCGKCKDRGTLVFVKNLTEQTMELV